MSKKESEFDRFNRMEKMERKTQAQKRKVIAFANESKKHGKVNRNVSNEGRQNWVKEYRESMEGEYSYDV